MPIITQADLATNIYAEVIEEITRADSSIADNAIETAVQEAKMYLAKYDLEQLFGTAEQEPAIRDAYLNSLVKDLACWHLLRLCNVSIDQAIFRTAYEDAIAALQRIMAGQAQPENWPYRDVATLEAPPDGSAVSWSSNARRSNFY